MFEAVANRANRAEADFEIGLAEPVEDLDALAANYDLSERVATIIEEGRLPDAKRRDDSRSAWLFDAVCGLVRAKVPNEIIVGILTDERYAISESVMERPDPEAYAERQVRSAHGKVADPATSDEDEIEPAVPAMWPRALRYATGRKLNNAKNGRTFVTQRPSRVVTSDGVMFGLRKDGVWMEVKEDALRAEMRQTNPQDTLQVHDISAMVTAVGDLT